jgi:hypothetical protein
MRKIAFIILFLPGVPTFASEALDEYFDLRTGSFSSAAQADQDARYETALWHIAEIWPAEPSVTRWIYTESWMQQAEAPYMQRVSGLTEQPDGTILARRYRFPSLERFVDAWREPERFADLDPRDLEEVQGCATTITRAGIGRFEGSTFGNSCLNTYKGASYAVSRSVVERDQMTNWDRGFRVDGKLVWGPAAGGYRFHRVGAENACSKPVRMLVYGEIEDRAAFGAYGRALMESGLYPRANAYYEAVTPPLEVFEGEPPPERGVIIARFPCIEAAREFWYSDTYAGIRPLREGIASFEVLVLPAPPIPPYYRD